MTVTGHSRNSTVVTGASTGIGRAIATALATRGDRVALIGQSIGRLQDTADSIRQLGGEAHVFSANIANIDGVMRVTENILSTFGDVDVLVNCAGVWHDAERSYTDVPLVQTSAAEICDVMHVGIIAPMLLAQAFIPGMIQKKRGKILQISGWFDGPRDARGWLHYYVSKRALEEFSNGLAEELREHTVQVNCISPGLTLTPAVQQFFPSEAGRALDPAAVAKVALYLLSEEANHITGACIVVRSLNDR